MKRIIKLSLLLLALLLPATANAYDFEVDGIYYEFYGNNATVTDADGNWDTPDYSGDVTIPETVTYNGMTYSVTAIGDGAFFCCSGLNSVNIPNSVTLIGYNAFEGCSGLTSVTICNSVTQICGAAFAGCSGLTSVIIPNSVTSIGYAAFSGCSGLTSISIPNSVYYISEDAFNGCSGLTSITVEGDNSEYDSRDNCNAIIKTSTNTLVTGCMNTVIPNTVTSIGNYAFYGCSGLTSINIPNSVTSIGNNAFGDCENMERVDITDLEAWCRINFSDDSNPCGTAHHLYLNGEEIINLIIPATITKVGKDVFQGCSYIKSVEFQGDISEIGTAAFDACSGLTSFDIPNTVTTINNYAFRGCSGLTDLIWNARNCSYNGDMPTSSIERVTIGNEVEVLPSNFVSGSKITTVTIPNSVTSIGYEAFRGCSRLTSISIGNSVTTIGHYAFRDCSGLTSIDIPNSVTSIGGHAFHNCTGLYSVFFNAVNCTSIGGNAFGYVNNLNNLQFGDSVQHIPAGLPSFNMYDKTLIIPNSVKTIDAGAIKGSCAGVVIGKGIEDIAAGAFPRGISVAYATTAEPLPCQPGAFINPQTLYVPAGSKMKYFTAPGWSEFTNIIEGEYTPATAVELDRDNVTLYRDASLQLSATVFPDSASTSALGWYSLNTNVASVDDNGMVYANGVGETDIIVWADQVSDTCHVKVTPIMVENITLNANHLSMALDETFTLTANATPANAENRTLEWIIPENDVIATIMTSENHLNIGAAGEGTVTITVRATDGSGISATCEVFVSANTPVKSLTLSPESMTLYVGNSQQLNAIITPQDAYTQDLRWMSSNSNVATVDNNGWVYGNGVGSAVITAVTTDGSNLSATCAVTVTNIPVESVTLNTSELQMNEGDYYYLNANVQPYNAYDRSLTWTSSNPRVATVTSNGRVNAQAVGTTIITATTNDGTNISAACRVTVGNQIADNCFVMPDTAVLHGEAIVIPVRMMNTQSIMAFQTDIYLPTGFNLVTNEDDEFVITPSSRLSSDHVIMTNRTSDGAIRVICYTPNSQPISGNEGDLFYFTVQVPDNAASDYAINLRNTLLTNTDYQELTIPDAGAVLMVNTFMPGDVNDSRSVNVTDIVLSAQYVLGMNPSPFIFEAADMNGDGNVTVTDIMLIAYLINHPTMNAPKRMPALKDCNDQMSGESVSLMAGETRTVSIMLDNEMDYTAFQMDLTMPEGLTAGNFQLTDRAGNHAFDVNAIDGNKMRALCYSPAIEVIDGNSGALLTFDVTATAAIEGDITVDGIELVTTDCQTVLLNGFAIGVNTTTSVNEVANGKTVARVDYFNLAGQRIDRPESGVTLVVTTYTDGTRTTTKLHRK